MGRSQIRKIKTQWVSSSGALYEEGALSPAVIYDLGSYSVPLGPAGGALQGSSLAGPAPVSVPVPTITSLAPNTAVIGGADLVMTVNGTNFLPNSLILFNNGVERTTYISPTQLSTGVKPSLAGVPGAYPVQVTNFIQKSNAQNFTFTATGGMEAPEGGRAPLADASGRTFPIGPFGLVRIDPADGGGVWYVLSKADGQNLVEGDDVTIEATGSTQTNGNYTVTQLQESGTERRFFVPDTMIAGPVEAKGRVTVTDGAT